MAELQALRNQVEAHSHPAAACFPLMGDDELRSMADDIAANGLREPIWRDLNDLIVDGRNRWIACQMAGIECHALKYVPDERGVLAFVVSHNLKRRHLDTGQRAMVAGRLATLPHGGDRRSDQAANLRFETPTVKKAAASLEVSERSVSDAKAVLASGAEQLIKAVDSGEVAVSKAANQARGGSTKLGTGRGSRGGGKGGSKKPAAPVTEIPTDVAALRDWLVSGKSLGDKFASGSDAWARLERAIGRSYMLNYVDAVSSFVAGLRSAARTVQAA